MQAEDQRLRWRAIEADDEAAAATWSAVSEIDRRHTARMREIVAEHGWPGHTLVGEDGAHAARLLIQHADQNPDFQRDCLALLATAVEASEAAPVDHAYLTDRWRWPRTDPSSTAPSSDGRATDPCRHPSPTPRTSNNAGATLGLSTLAGYAKSINRTTRPPSTPQT